MMNGVLSISLFYKKHTYFFLCSAKRAACKINKFVARVLPPLLTICVFEGMEKVEKETLRSAPQHIYIVRSEMMFAWKNELSGSRFAVAFRVRRACVFCSLCFWGQSVETTHTKNFVVSAILPTNSVWRAAAAVGIPSSGRPIVAYVSPSSIPDTFLKPYVYCFETSGREQRRS